MELLQTIGDVILNYGIGVVCILYFMYFNNTTLKQLTETVNKVNQSLILFNERLENIEDALYKNKKKSKKE